MAAAPGITTSGQPPTAVVQVQPGMNVQPVVLVDQNGNFVSSGGSGTATTLESLTTGVNVSNATAPTSGQVLTAVSGTIATWQNPSSGFANPMTTAGDMIAENTVPTAVRVTGNTTATKNFLTQTGTGSASALPVWGTIASGDMPTGTTGAKGALQLDGTAGDIQPVGASAAAGSVGKAADAGHVHVGLLPSNNLSDVGAAATAFANIAPLTTKGDLIIENGTPAPARLAIGTAAGAAGDFLGVSGGLPAWQQVSGQYLCAPTQYAPPQTTLTISTTTFAAVSGAATTVASGSNGGEISAVASWSSPSAGVLDVASSAAFPSSGGTFTVATSSTTATCTYTGTAAGQLTGVAYVSGSATGTVSTGGAVTLISAAASTGSFTAPASGSVVVTATFAASIATGSDYYAIGLCAHGTTTPMVGYAQVMRPSDSNLHSYSLSFIVTGLTPGSSYDFDLMGASQSGISTFILANAQTSTSPTLSSSGYGQPVTMTVQAV